VRRLKTEWRGTQTLEIDGAMATGYLVSVRMNADSGWHAAADGGEIPVETDNLGFMLLHPASSATHIEMQYRAPAEPRIMAAISVLSWVCALTGLFLWRKRSDSPTTN